MESRENESEAWRRDEEREIRCQSLKGFARFLYNQLVVNLERTANSHTMWTHTCSRNSQTYLLNVQHLNDLVGVSTDSRAEQGPSIFQKRSTPERRLTLKT